LPILFALVCVSCIPKKKPGESPGAGNVAEGKSCPADDGLIDDAEDGNNGGKAIKGRGGYWYTFADDAGSIIEPVKGGTFMMASGGANGSQFAARFKGKVGGGKVVYAGVGVNFTEPRGPYDASHYGGISFWAKRGEGTGSVRLKVPDINTSDAGKICTECFNDFGADLQFTEKWTKYVIPFSEMKQLSGWGSPHPPAIDRTKIYGVQFQVNSPNQAYDIWVDQLEFTGCK
jgi:endoglucanase